LAGETLLIGAALLTGEALFAVFLADAGGSFCLATMGPFGPGWHGCPCTAWSTDLSATACNRGDLSMVK
jgi:hypothetical protein